LRFKNFSRTSQRVKAVRDQKVPGCSELSNLGAFSMMILQRDEWQCLWPGCGQESKKLHCHHILPIKDGGRVFSPSNAIALCEHHHKLVVHGKRGKKARSGFELYGARLLGISAGRHDLLPSHVQEAILKEKRKETT
jgi:hypothetical protein